VAYWESALEIDPTFQPASRNIEVAERAMKLQQTMEDLEKVE
jgi:hypothetical protein